MRKLILMMLLAAASGSAIAEWFKIDESKIIPQTTYVEPGSIARSGNKAKMWVLYDYKETKTVEQYEYKSMKVYAEYDCKEAQSRIISYLLHEENMGKGKVISSSGEAIPSNWVPVPPKSIDEFLMQAACEASSAAKGKYM